MRARAILVYVATLGLLAPAALAGESSGDKGAGAGSNKKDRLEKIRERIRKKKRAQQNEAKSGGAGSDQADTKKSDDTTDEPAGEKSGKGKPAGEKSGKGKPVGEKSGKGKPAGEKASTGLERAAEELEKTRERLAETQGKLDQARERLERARDEAGGVQVPPMVRAHLDELRKTRKARRRARQRRIQKRWGKRLLKRPGAQAELTRHARRMARLKRIHAVAEAEGRDKLAARAEELIEKETRRHERRLETLRGEAAESDADEVPEKKRNEASGKKK